MIVQWVDLFEQNYISLVKDRYQYQSLVVVKCAVSLVIVIEKWGMSRSTCG